MGKLVQVNAAMLGPVALLLLLNSVTPSLGRPLASGMEARGEI